MAENSAKRERDDSPSSEFDESNSASKRQKPYTNILTLLDEEEEEEPASEPGREPSHELSRDLSAIFSTLEQELSSSSTTTSCDSAAANTAFDFESLPSTAEADAAERSELPAAVEGGGGDGDESVKSVMRHLLEASDDELGIPNARDESGGEDFNSGENLPFGFADNGLWELEDVAANYYTVLQSELFM